MFRRQPGIHLIFFQTSSLPSALLSSSDPMGTRWLSASERARFDRYVADEKKREFLSSRLHARSLLAQWLNASIESLSFAASGRPQVSIDGVPTSVGISLAHSNGIGVYALSDDWAPGVDLEYSQRSQTVDWERTFLTQNELDDLEHVVGHHRSQFILDRWLAKEAAYKCVSADVPLSAGDFQVSTETRENNLAQRSLRECKVKVSKLGKSLRCFVFELYPERFRSYEQRIEICGSQERKSSQYPWSISVTSDNRDEQDNPCNSFDWKTSVKTWFHSENQGLFTFDPFHPTTGFVQFTSR